MFMLSLILLPLTVFSKEIIHCRTSDDSGGSNYGSDCFSLNTGKYLGRDMTLKYFVNQGFTLVTVFAIPRNRRHDDYFMYHYYLQK
ncbi:MAG: hypothetical protein DRR16_33250 [Candidatus Parabeggiatoa sp. nov. 3]|nr:MAG: hypothetical protein DRR00_29990 [Gammaproteobacteria bacterium]RKZ56497.1 MAG: hypothetical protein DRQ99_28395 [Gammaproteobacteria bacterium]RKZ73251.1 MAG: hypothetical protein DRR16_33250 [Gammaproteobacteria bacterium]